MIDAADIVPVGIAGLGRSGWDIHARSLSRLPERYRVTAVMDPDAGRRAEAAAALGARPYHRFDDLLADPEVALVVVATPSREHPTHAVAALLSGRDVVVEKPMALDVADADRMIRAAADRGRVLAPFQNRRYEPHFRKVHEVIESGVLGRVVQIRMVWHGFSRRWDWQTLREYGGGLLHNNGPHLLDHALELFGPAEPEVFVDLRNVLSSGDAEDHVKIVLRAPESPTIDVELTSASAYAQERWHVMGSAGGLRGSTSRLEWRWVDWSTMPERPVERAPTPDRSYNSESLAWSQASWHGEGEVDTSRESLAFYRDLHASLRLGQPLVVTPESVRRHIALIAYCRRRYPL